MAKKLRHGDNLDIYGVTNYKLDHSKTSRQLDEEYGYTKTKGIADFKHKKICIATDQSQEDKQSTFIHELFEIMKRYMKFGWMKEGKIKEAERFFHHSLKQTGADLWEFE